MFVRDAPARRFKRGDVLEVRGTVHEYAGQEEVLCESVHHLSHTEPPPPTAVSAAELNSKRFSGRLGRVAGDPILPGDLIRPYPALRDASGTIQVYFINRFLQSPAFLKRFVQGGRVELVGIARQRRTNNDPASGYMIAPRETADFHFAPLHPYGEVATGAALALLLIGYLWLRRRAAERRASEFRRLSDTLRDSEERFRQMADNIEQTFWTFNPKKSRYMYISPAYSNMWGRDPKELHENGALFLRTIHSEDINKVQAFFRRQSVGPAEELFRIVKTAEKVLAG